MLFILPSGVYNEDFLNGLAMVSRLKLIKAEELNYWFNTLRLSHEEIAKRCLSKLKKKVK